MKIIKKSFTEQELSQNGNYNAVDLAKFLMSLCVVYAHISFLRDSNPAVNEVIVKYLVRLTVPFFFIATSFFLFRKTENDKQGYDRIKRYVMKFFRLYCLWTLVYIPAIVVDKVIKYPYGGIFDGLKYAIIEIFKGASYTQLWFLAALFIGTTVTALCMKARLKPITIVCFALVIYLTGIYLQNYYGLFFSFIYIALGLVFAKKRIVLDFNIALAGFLVSMVSGYLEIFVFPVNQMVENGEMWFSLIPVSFFLFYMIVHIELKDRTLYVKLRELSMMLYYTHMLVNFGYRCTVKIFEQLLGGKALQNMLFQYISVVTVSLLISEGLLQLSRKKKFAWIKLFY